MTYEEYKNSWSQKTTKQVEKELKSWRAYMDKNGRAYAWHGKGMTPPGELGDGDKVAALREILEERNCQGKLDSSARYKVNARMTGKELPEMNENEDPAPIST